MTQEVAVAEAAMPINRECRVIWHFVVEIEAAKPAVGEMQLNLLTEPPLKANAVAVAHNQHPDHELGIDRRPANVAVERRELLSQVSQNPRYDRIDPAQQIARRNTLFEVKQIEQLALIARLPAHHDPPPSLIESNRRNHGSPEITSPFFNSIDPSRSLAARFAVMHGPDPAIVVRDHWPLG